MLKGNIWQISVLGVLLALTPAIIDVDSGAAGVTGDIAGVLGTISPVYALLFFLGIMGAVVIAVFGDSGGGF